MGNFTNGCSVLRSQDDQTTCKESNSNVRSRNDQIACKESNSNVKSRNDQTAFKESRRTIKSERSTLSIVNTAVSSGLFSLSETEVTFNQSNKVFPLSFQYHSK